LLASQIAASTSFILAYFFLSLSTAIIWDEGSITIQ